MDSPYGESACVCVWSSLAADWASTGYGCQSCLWSAEQGKRNFPCLRSRLRVWSRELGLAVPSLKILHSYFIIWGSYLLSVAESGPTALTNEKYWKDSSPTALAYDRALPRGDMLNVAAVAQPGQEGRIYHAKTEAASLNAVLSFSYRVLASHVWFMTRTCWRQN